MSEGTHRKLAAIVSSDVVGYSRLMGADEAGTHARLKARFSELIGPSIAEHRGRVVKLMGDGLLAEFPSVVDAVNWAVGAQSEVAQLNAGETDDQRIDYRVGVNLGDVIVDGDDIFGDGVNVAARLQEIAEPGGIALSDIVYSQIREKLDTLFSDGGTVEMKNIAQPVHVWRWPAYAQETTRPRASEQQAALSLPDKPSVAVLPFDNMSGDPEQDYFVDGMVEDVLTTLSKVPDLFVIARNSSFTYKGKNVDVRQVGRELGVRYVVEGSVRKAGNRVRVTAQLIDCANGQHIWAERYDGDLDDIFGLQDRLTREIVTKLEVNLTDGEVVGVWRERSGSPLVYEKFLKGRDLYSKFSRATHRHARLELEAALEINPTYPPAMFQLGLTLVDEARFGWASDKETAFGDALAIAQRGLEIDPNNGELYCIVSYARTYQRRYEEAIEAAEKSIEVSPNHSDVYHMSAMAHIYAGNFETARDYELQYGRLNPLVREVSLVDLARAQFHLGDFEEARKLSQTVLLSRPDWLTAKTILIAALHNLGDSQETNRLCAELMQTHPKFSVARWSKGWPYRRPEDLAALMDPLRTVGLPA